VHFSDKEDKQKQAEEEELVSFIQKLK